MLFCLRRSEQNILMVIFNDMYMLPTCTTSHIYTNKFNGLICACAAALGQTAKANYLRCICSTLLTTSRGMRLAVFLLALKTCVSQMLKICIRSNVCTYTTHNVSNTHSQQDVSLPSPVTIQSLAECKLVQPFGHTRFQVFLTSQQDI